MTIESRDFDVVIAGGAMTGATLALILSNAMGDKVSIAVVEPYLAESSEHPGFDSRSIALSFGTVEILKRFFLWDELAVAATPIEHISVTDQGHAGMTEITAQEHHLSALGYVVELADVGKIYANMLKESSSITFFSQKRIIDVQRSIDSVAITLDDDCVINSKLLVAADGAQSDSSKQIGLALDEHDFNQVAVIANIGLSEDHNGRAFERFTQSGPLALLPMSQNRMSLVWCVSPDRADELMQSEDSLFLEQLQSQFGWRLGALKKVGQRSSYPLVLRSRPQTISHRFAAVGNAAQTLHPIAGQGFNLGIRDVSTLVECLQAQVSQDNQLGIDLDLGKYQGLEQYRQRREQDRELTITMTSSLVHLFSNTWWPTVVGRNLGLMAFDTLPAVKAPLFKRTLGLVSR
ncbi:2-octaprenyl-6-methoxyphenyl hydroxylase [Vibrio sp. RC27]